MMPSGQPLSIDGSSPAWSVAPLEQKSISIDTTKTKKKKQQIVEQIPVMTLAKKEATMKFKYADITKPKTMDVTVVFYVLEANKEFTPTAADVERGYVKATRQAGN